MSIDKMCGSWYNGKFGVRGACTPRANVKCKNKQKNKADFM